MDLVFIVIIQSLINLLLVKDKALCSGCSCSSAAGVRFYAFEGRLGRWTGGNGLSDWGHVFSDSGVGYHINNGNRIGPKPGQAHYVKHNLAAPSPWPKPELGQTVRGTLDGTRKGYERAAVWWIV